MRIKANISGQCILVPSDAVLSRLSECSGTQLKVLLSVLAAPEFDEAELCEKLDITKKTFRASLDYWCSEGVIAKEGEAQKTKKTESQKTEDRISEKKQKTIMKAAALPSYTMDELCDKLEIEGYRDLVDECQRIMGKGFTMSETQTVVGLKDYLKLSEDYIYLLFAYCSNIDKKSMRYIEKMAVELFDSGIVEYRDLDAHITGLETARTLEGPIRHLFGIGRRAFTKKEKEMVGVWSKRAYSRAIIEKAYEVTVNNTGNGSMPYCHTVLDNWYQQGLLTVEAVEENMEKYKHDKEGAKDKKGSFDTDDFFAAALRRSYDEN